MIRRLLATLRRNAIRSMSPNDAHQLTRRGPAILLDVRESHEWKAGHAPQARHVPLGQLADRMSQLPRDRPIVTVCRSGHRSRLAARQLTAGGLEAINLDGGMNAWTAAGLPTTGR